MNPRYPDGNSPNADPLTGETGAHPVGTGIGAMTGGLTSGVALGSLVIGPVGAVAGAALGAIIGGLIGHGIAEKNNPTAASGSRRGNSPRPTYHREHFDDFRHV